MTRRLFSRRTRLVWPLTVPLLVLGLLAGHWLGYRLAINDPHARAHVLDGTGHSYMSYAPEALAVLVSLLLLAFAFRVLGSLHGRPPVTTPAWMFAVLPPLAFTVQEHLERLLVDAHGAPTPLLQTPFLIGLALQIPFALLSVFVADALGRAAEVVARAVARPFLRARAVRRWRAPASTLLLRPVGLALGYSGRGPPLSD